MANLQALRFTSHQEMREALSRIPVPAFVFDTATGRFLATNDRFGDLIGYSCEELLRMTVEHIQPDERIAGCHEARTQVPPQGLLRWTYRCKSGVLLNVRVHYREVAYPSDTAGINARFVVVEFWQEAAA